MYKIGLKKLIGIFLSLIFLVVMVGPASALVFDLCTGQTTMTMPDGEIIPVWGFGIEDSTLTCESATVPGPVLEVPVADPNLTINLRNTLPDPVSLNIAGQILLPGTGPVWSELDGTVVANPRGIGNYTARVRSFAHEADASGGMASYIWPNFKIGSYLLSSGTNPAKQVQMGLYLVVKKDAAAGMAYADNPGTPGDESVPYDKEVVLIYSEVDPLINAAITAGTYGPGGTITNSLHRDPKYFLINGMAFEPAGGLDPVNAATPINPGDTVLIRFLNAGYETHVPQLLNMYMSLVAEDGNPYAYAKEQYGVQLPAGKTVDAILAPAATGRFPLYDAAHHLTNNGTPAMGGMLAYLLIEAGAPVCPGDFDGDGDVDGTDLAVFAADFGRTDCGIPTTCPGDFNNDGDVDGSDLAIFAADFGRTDCPIVGP